MNTKYINLLRTGGVLWVLALALTNCNSFLEEYSQDEVAPKSVREYSQILYGEAYLRDAQVPYAYVEVLTDNVKSVVGSSKSSGSDVANLAWGYYSWQQNPELTRTNSLHSDGSWLTFYRHILTSNIILKEIDRMSGTAADKAQLKGEAHAVRLNAYFYLTNLYAKPYDPATAAATQGVPLNDKAHAEDAQFPRATLADSYAQMAEDIKGAEQAFIEANRPTDIFTWNLAAVTILASRVYLYMQDYDKAIEYATKALKLKPTLQDLNDLDKTKDIFLTKKNPEIAYSYGFWNPQYFASANKSYYTVSDELMALYTEGDLRAGKQGGLFINTKRERVGGLFFPRYVYTTTVTKGGNTSDTGCYGFAIRSAEALLNRAEAYAEKGELAKAMADLNTLRKHRFAKGTAPLAEPATQAEVIQMVRLERRLELAFEQHRWFDLRRWDQPEIKHSFIVNQETKETEEYTLSQGDPRYTLPIPQAVIESDPSLE